MILSKVKKTGEFDLRYTTSCTKIARHRLKKNPLFGRKVVKNNYHNIDTHVANLLQIKMQCQDRGRKKGRKI
jgi:hypothetical protein